MSEREELFQYYLGVTFNSQSILIGIGASLLFAFVFVITRYIPLEQPLFHAQKIYQNTSFIIVFMLVFCISLFLWFFILGLSIFGFRFYYEEVRFSQYQPMGALLGLVFVHTIGLGHRSLWIGWQGGIYDVQYGKIFSEHVMLLIAGGIILRNIKKPVFHSFLFAYFFILSSFYFIFNVFMKIFTGEDLILKHEFVNYMVNSNLLGFLIWYVIFGFFFPIT
ncbi:MAG: hypothetical protein LBS45_06380 [Synergistaceae bacterium]|nr:hypothetical protein [Synergistaceae bacterium]